MGFKIVDQFRSRFANSEELRVFLNADVYFWKDPLYQKQCILRHLHTIGKVTDEKFQLYSQNLSDRIILGICRKPNQFDLYRHLLTGNSLDSYPMTMIEMEYHIREFREAFFCKTIEDFLINIVHREDLVERFCVAY